MTQSDFQRRFSEDVPLAPGSVRGVRTWNVVTEPVRLIGQAGGTWSVDGNIAECRDFDQQWQRMLTGEQHAQCAGVAVDCTCGFYAYWTDTRERVAFSPPRVVGVIEGWGKVTIGSRGFRCEKARILAIAPGDIDGVRWQQVRDAYPDLPAYALVTDMLAAWPPSDPPEGFEPEPEPTFSYGGIVKVGQMIGRVGSTGPHLHYTRPSASLGIFAPGGIASARVTVNVNALQDALRDAAKSMTAAIDADLAAIASDIKADDEQGKRDQALDKVRNRNTGPSRNPFRRRRSQR